MNIDLLTQTWWQHGACIDATWTGLAYHNAVVASTPMATLDRSQTFCKPALALDPLQPFHRPQTQTGAYKKASCCTPLPTPNSSYPCNLTTAVTLTRPPATSLSLYKSRRRAMLPSACMLGFACCLKPLRRWKRSGKPPPPPSMPPPKPPRLKPPRSPRMPPPLRSLLRPPWSRPPSMPRATPSLGPLRTAKQ